MVMCVTSGKATLSSTYIGIWDVNHPQYGYRHVLAYQNNPKNLDFNPNCMLLHIPTCEYMNSNNIIDASGSPGFLRSMFSSTVESSRNVSFEGNTIIHSGIYHLAILNNLNPEQIEETIQLIPDRKRPDINEELFEFYRDNYSHYSLVLCCFNNQDAGNASPIVIQYKPWFPQYFHLTTLESHGSIPSLGQEVPFHQNIVVGYSNEHDPGWEFDEVLNPWLPKYARSASLDVSLPNYDLIIDRKKFISSHDIPFLSGKL